MAWPQGLEAPDVEPSYNGVDLPLKCENARKNLARDASHYTPAFEILIAARPTSAESSASAVSSCATATSAFIATA